MRIQRPWNSILFGLLLTTILIASGWAQGKAQKGGNSSPYDPAITYTTLDGNLMVMNADTTNPKTILRSKPNQQGNRMPSWSPDGSRIVFASDINGAGLYIINRDGTGLCKLVALNDTQNLLARPVWSPLPLADGRNRIAYTDKPNASASSPHLLVVNADCQNPGTANDLSLSAGLGIVRHPTWSPFANKLAVTAVVAGPPYNSIFVYDIAVLNGQVVITSTTNLTGSLGQRMSSPEWAPTGDRIAVSADPCSPDCTGVPLTAFDLWIVDFINPSNSYNLSNSSDRGERWATWSPDASEIFYHYVIYNNRGYDAKVLVASGAVTDVIGNSQYPSWRKCFRTCPPNLPGCQLCK